jgi:glycosyltransferase involved in cell wall biosynthesis
MSGTRIGVYLDDVYHVSGPSQARRVSSDRSFLGFITELGARFDDLVIFGRALETATPSDYLLPPGTVLVELPHYASLYDARDVLPTVPGTLLAFARGLSRVDVVWLFGPHPYALAFVLMALARRKRVVLGVRQNSVELYEARLASRWSPPMLAIRALDGAYRLLSRRLKTTVQGDVLARRFGGDRPGLLPMTESIVRERDVVARPVARDWSGTVELLTVGRLEPEKNPLLLVDAFAELERRRPGRYRLTWVGRGPMDAEVRHRVAELRLESSVELLDYVPFGDPLLSLYRRAHLFVHVSLSEGMPKVLIEALASGAPVVATDVGGVRSALDDGRAGVLVGPNDAASLVSAIERLSDDPRLRDQLVDHGLKLASALTLEAQVAAVERFIRDDTG